MSHSFFTTSLASIPCHSLPVSNGRQQCHFDNTCILTNFARLVTNFILLFDASLLACFYVISSTRSVISRSLSYSMNKELALSQLIIIQPEHEIPSSVIL